MKSSATEKENTNTFSKFTPSPSFVIIQNVTYLRLNVAAAVTLPTLGDPNFPYRIN